MSSINRVALKGSVREPMVGSRAVGPTDPNERIQVTVRLRHRQSPDEAVGAATSSRAAAGAQPHLSREEYAARYGANPADLALVETFAKQHNLVVVESDLARRSVMLEGTAAALSDAFQVRLEQYAARTHSYRGRVGAIQVPADLAEVVEGVFGLDNRPVATTHYRRPKSPTGVQARVPGASFSPDTLAKLYNFPAGLDGHGQTVAIIELGGGFSQTDLDHYFHGLGLPTPQVTARLIDHALNQPVPGSDSPDGEVMLDIEVVGAVAPGAKIVVYFAPNTDKGFLDAVTAAVNDATNKPSVISISWGGAEKRWTQQAIDNMNEAFKAAALMGVTVTCAAGDTGSADMSSGDDDFDNLAHVDFPASSPFALACGGTRLSASGNSITSEVVWNDGPDSATGGGISDVFDVPDYQQHAHIPHSANPGGRTGRGVPDVSGVADPETGYQVRVHGEDGVIGGTSAVAPLWAGLVARLNQSLGHSVGALQAVLYENPQVCRPITQGNNGAYQAGPGWNACTGLGSPDGAKLLAALQGAGPTNATPATPAQPRFVPFADFIKQTAGAKADEPRLASARLADAHAFGQMRAHILSLYQGVRATHSFMGEDGSFVDCIPIEQQPSLRQGPAAGSRVASAPTPAGLPMPSSERGAGTSAALSPHLERGNHDQFGNERYCPPGTIPMRRITLEELARFGSLEDYFRKAPLVKGHPRITARDTVPHRYAHAYQFVNNNGGSSWLNLWLPVPTPSNFSLVQHWYTGGSGAGLQTVEGGWQVYPAHYSTNNGVLFIYWTADGYNHTGNYNLDKPAFVQTNSSWVLGGAFNSYSTRDGDQREFLMHWQRDTSNGNWWLFLQGSGALTPIGYYPRSLFGSGQMASFATEIDYGGEVTGTTSGQMGSGAFAAEGFRRAAYQRAIANFPTSGASSWANLTADQTNPSCYTIDLHNNAPGDWATYFFLGGPHCG